MKIKKEIPDMKKNMPIGISIYSVTHEAPHYHENIMEIIYCFKGTLRLHYGYEEIEIKDGDIITCNALTIHSLSSSEDNLVISFYLDLKNPVFTYPDFDKILFICEKYVLTHEKQNEMQHLKHILLTLLYFYCFPNEMVSFEKICNDIAGKIMDMMVTHFHSYHYANTSPDYSPEEKARQERLQVYISTHFREKITIQTLCQKEHLTSNYLSHFFQKAFYLGLPNYLNFIRVRHSELLLLTTDKNITEISYEVGYSDPKFYYRYFKAWYKHTPFQHRKLYENKIRQSEENTRYLAQEMKSTLEHYISYYFATLYMPDLWNVSFTYMRNVPY